MKKLKTLTDCTTINEKLIYIHVRQAMEQM
jgi:hypothetical protein